MLISTNASKMSSKISSGAIEMGAMEQASGLCAKIPLPSPPASTRKRKLPQQPPQRALERTEDLLAKCRIANAAEGKMLRDPLTGSSMNGMGYQRSFQNMTTPQKKPTHGKLEVKATKSKRVLHLVPS